MNRILKLARIIISVTVFSVITGALAGYGASSQPAIAQWLEKIQLIPAVITFSLAIFVTWIGTTLIFGRIYCSSVCPLGTWQDICSRLPRIGKRGRKSRLDYHYSPPRNQLRYLSLIVILSCLMGGFLLLPSIIDPYSAWERFCTTCIKPILTVFTGHSPGENAIRWSYPAARLAMAGALGMTIAIISIGAVSLIAAKNGRTYCNTICPIGTTLGIISRYSIFQIDIDTDKCIQCRNCEHVCKASCINLTDHVVDGSRCVNCFDCINVCPNDAIHYTPRRKKLSIPMMQRIGQQGIAGTARAGMGISQQNLTSTKISDTEK